MLNSPETPPGFPLALGCGALGAVILVVILLIYWRSHYCDADSDGAVAEQAADRAAAVARVGENIHTICSCRAENPLRIITIDALDGLWEQYTQMAGCAAAAESLYLSLADIEDELRALADAIEAADFPDESTDWPRQAARAFRDLPRNVHLLGAQLELE